LSGMAGMWEDAFGALGLGPEFGGVFVAIGSSIKTTGDVLDEFRDQLTTVDEALAGMVSSGDADLAARAFEEISIKARLAGISQEQLMLLFPEYFRQLDRQAEAQDRVTTAVEKATAAMKEQHDEMRAQAD